MLVTAARPHSNEGAQRLNILNGGTPAGREETKLEPKQPSPRACRHPRHCTPKNAGCAEKGAAWCLPALHPAKLLTVRRGAQSWSLGGPVAVKAEPKPEPRKAAWPSRLSEPAAAWPAQQGDRALGPSEPASGVGCSSLCLVFLGSSVPLPVLPSSPLHFTAWRLGGHEVGPGRRGRVMGSLSAPTVWATCGLLGTFPGGGEEWFSLSWALGITAVAGVTGGVQASPRLWTARASACQSSGQGAPRPQAPNKAGAEDSWEGS